MLFGQRPVCQKKRSIGQFVKMMAAVSAGLPEEADVWETAEVWETTTSRKSNIWIFSNCQANHLDEEPPVHHIHVEFIFNQCIVLPVHNIYQQKPLVCIAFAQK